MPRLRSLDLFFSTAAFIGGLLLFVACSAVGQDVVFRLAGDDRVSGTLISEGTNNVVISNAWAARLSIPLNQIVTRTTNAAAASLAKADFCDRNFAGENGQLAGGIVGGSGTNGWKREAQIGVDLLFGPKERQILYARLKLGYQRPYKSDPKKFFRNFLDYSAEYGKTEGMKSSDRMNASDKTSFDLVGKWYLYNLAGGGYDHRLEIDAQYEAGPGIGYRLYSRTNFLITLEGGMNYQAQFRRDGSDLQDVYYRFAEELSWKLRPRTSLIEKLEFFPRVNVNGFRLRFESTLSYELWKNISLNLTALDLYEAQPAENVSNNELQIRSSLGVKF